MTNEQYYDLIVPYQDALNLFKARLDVLNHSMYGSASHLHMEQLNSYIFISSYPICIHHA